MKEDRDNEKTIKKRKKNKQTENQVVSRDNEDEEEG